MTRRRQVVLCVLALGVLGLLSTQLAKFARRLDEPVHVDLAFTKVEELAWHDREDLVVDARAGYRMRRHLATTRHSAPLGRPDEPQEFVLTTCDQGLVRDARLPAAIPGPRVLVLGDDQTVGAVPIGANWTAVLERGLRARSGPLTTTHVLDAACEGYGLLHHALRGPELVARYDPRVVVIAIAAGDDVVALDDRHLPHLDETAFPAAPAFGPATDPLGIQVRAARLCPGWPDLARHGLAQAAYLRQVPERSALLDRKARTCLGWFREIAPRSGLLVVLIPPADLARPREVAALCSAEGRELLASDVQARAYATLIRALEDRGVPYADMLPALRDADDPDVYRADGRLGTTGHRILAEALVDRIAGFIRRR